MDCILLTWKNTSPSFIIQDPIAFLLPSDTPDEVLKGVIASIHQRGTCYLIDLTAWASYPYNEALTGAPVTGPGLRIQDEDSARRFTFTKIGDNVELVARHVTGFRVEETDDGTETVRWREPDGKEVQIQRKVNHVVGLYREHL